jgi:pyrroline-5-carboxylate reductase|mmetsp:Transcript_50434/g.132843  ORF Transcript_50434/g.132843 Transcript_50434/m.132843 type:complete len:290 (-) Transcript_50434:15-884(-)
MSSVQDSKVPTLSSVGFIGAGKMATAIMDGLVAKSVVSTPESIACSDVFEMAVTDASKKGYHATKSNQEVCQRSKDAIILAVKPNIIPDICADVMNAGGSALIISVAAGVTLETLEKNLPGRRVVRVMPNTACLVGEAASGYAMGSLCNADDNQIVQLIFGSCGLAREFKEVLLNAVTGVSGSGPAYVFQFIEALADGGVRAGLPREDAVLLAAQTLKGAAEMVLVTGMHPGQLKDMVCSPGGTTITGVDELEKGGLRTTVMQAVKAATRRSMQLGGITEEEITTKYNL